MKVKEGFVLRAVGEKILVVPVGKTMASFNGMLVLNKTGKFLWDNLQKDIEVEDLVKILMQNYSVEEDFAKKDVLEFIKKLQSAGIIE